MPVELAARLIVHIGVDESQGECALRYLDEEAGEYPWTDRERWSMWGAALRDGPSSDRIVHVQVETTNPDRVLWTLARAGVRFAAGPITTPAPSRRR